MKKFLIMMAAIIAAVTVNAQALMPSKFMDNTYVSLRYGVTGLMHPSSFKYVGGTCIDTPNGFAHSLAQQTELQFGKYITPKFGVALDGVVSWDTFSSRDNMSKYTVPFITVSALAKYRFVNNDKFAFVAVTGPGWVHVFVKDGADANDLMVKFQFEFTYKLNDKWNIDVVPELNYNLTRNGANKQPYFDSRDAWYGLSVGVTYNIGNKFEKCPYEYTQGDVDRLNTQINELREELAKKPTEVVKEVVKEVEKVVPAMQTRYVVAFDFGKANLDAVAKDVLNQIAPNTNVVVEGETSFPGTETYNKKLSEQRANAVADYLRARNVNVNGVKGLGETGHQVVVVTVK